MGCSDRERERESVNSKQRSWKNIRDEQKQLESHQNKDCIQESCEFNATQTHALRSISEKLSRYK